MADLEKVIRGLESCLREDISDYKCEQCPYLKETNCLIKIKRDALELLKEYAVIKETISDEIHETAKMFRKTEEHDCRDCKIWLECPNGMRGHIEGTSIGFSIGECADFIPKRTDT